MEFSISQMAFKIASLLSSKDLHLNMLVKLILMKAQPCDYKINFVKHENSKYILSINLMGQDRFSSIESSIEIPFGPFRCDDKLSFSTNIEEEALSQNDYTFKMLFITDILLKKLASNILINTYTPKVKLEGTNIIHFSLEAYSIYHRVESECVVDMRHFDEPVKKLIMKDMRMGVTLIDGEPKVYQKYKLIENHENRYTYEPSK
jgi:hypothetical protein